MQQFRESVTQHKTSFKHQSHLQANRKSVQGYIKIGDRVRLKLKSNPYNKVGGKLERPTQGGYIIAGYDPPSGFLVKKGKYGEILPNIVLTQELIKDTPSSGRKMLQVDSGSLIHENVSEIPKIRQYSDMEKQTP